MTIKQAAKQAADKLLKAGIDNPAFDTMCIIEHIFGLDRVSLSIHGESIADENKIKYLDACIDRRINKEPIQYIVGKWSFMGNDYFVGDGVLIPRDDTEVLVNCCIDILKCVKNPTVIDLCSGSGIIAITIKKLFKNARVYAVEKSGKAFSYLTKNCKLNCADVKCINADINSCHSDFNNNYFDLVVSNPPYIMTNDIPSLQKEISYEPKMALDGGIDGYDFYKSIISNWTGKIKPYGHLAFEIGENQFDIVSSLMKSSHFTDIKSYDDILGIKRSVTGKLNA